MTLARRNAKYLQKTISIPFTHGSVSATTTVKLYKTSTSRLLRIDRVVYNNPTGLVTDAANYFDVRILNAATVAAKWSTLTGANGSLPVNVPTDLVLQAAATLILPVSTELALTLVLTGTATLPAGIGLIEATLI